MTNTINAAWRNSRQHHPSHVAVRKPTTQPVKTKKFDDDMTFYQFQRYLELLKLTNSQFRLQAPKVGSDSDDSGVDEAMSGDERENEGSSQHASTTTSVDNVSSNHASVQPQQAQINNHGSVDRARSGNAKASLLRCRENEHGYPYYAGASQIPTKGSMTGKQFRVTSGMDKYAAVDNTSRMCGRNVAEHGDKAQPTMLTSRNISQKSSPRIGRNDPDATTGRTRLEDNSPWDMSGIEDSRCHRPCIPSTRRPDRFNTTCLPPLSRDTTLTSRRDQQVSANTLTTPIGSRTNKMGVRFGGNVTSASTSVNDLTTTRRRSKRAVGSSSTCRSSSSGSGGKSSAPSVHRRPFPSISHYPRSESKRWVFTNQPTALRLYVSYYEPPPEKFVEGITASDGTPLLPSSRQHILRGMVYNRHTKSIHPPVTRSMKRGVNLVRKVGGTTRCFRTKTVTRNVDKLDPSTFLLMVSRAKVFSLK